MQDKVNFWKYEFLHFFPLCVMFLSFSPFEFATSNEDERKKDRKENWIGRRTDLFFRFLFLSLRCLLLERGSITPWKGVDSFFFFELTLRGILNESRRAWNKASGSPQRGGSLEAFGDRNIFQPTVRRSISFCSRLVLSNLVPKCLDIPRTR